MTINSLDFYKAGHGPQYPAGTEYVYSNWTPRSTKYAKTDKITVFGIQAFILEHLIDKFNREFFQVDVDNVIEVYQRRMDNALGYGVVGTEHIRALHELGYLPVEIKALPEGVQVLPKIPVMTIINTKPEFFWLTNYLETVASCELWLPMTSASIARKYKDILQNAAVRTGTPLEFVPLQGHDFSMRGMSGVAAAAMSGAGHLLSFAGTDTVPAIDYVEEYYGADSDIELVGCSVPATEHSVMCMGTESGELDTFKRLLNMYPSGVVSIVSDTWDFWKVMTDFAPALRNDIIKRKPVFTNFFEDFEVFEYYEQAPLAAISEWVKEKHEGPMYAYNGHTMYKCTPYYKGSMWFVNFEEIPVTVAVPAKTVFRPDSGDPVEILCGAKIKDYSDFSSFSDALGFALEDLEENELRADHGEYGRDVASGLISYRGKYYKVVAKAEWNRYDKQFYFIESSWIDDYEEVELSPEQKGAVEVLWETFGGHVTDKGYKQLGPVGLIYGDSITLERAQEIMDRLEAKGFASGNVVLGIGSFTYQFNTRDTYGFAMKATWGQVNGEPRDIMKNPKTDDGTKKSARGLLRVELENGNYVCYDQQTKEQEKQGELKTVFKDGKLVRFQTLAEIRERLQND